MRLGYRLRLSQRIIVSMSIAEDIANNLKSNLLRAGGRTDRDTEAHSGHEPGAYWERFSEFVFIAILVTAALVAIKISWHWPMVRDGSFFQYGAFLMDHGKVLYRDLYDLNFPGAYFSSWLATHLFGHSDFGWRLYDLLFLLLGCLGIAWICKPFGRLATITGSCLLILLHVRFGPIDIGERDFQVTVLELLAAGFMLRGFRHGKPSWFLASGITSFAGGTIKPTGFLFLAAFLAQAIVVSYRRRLTQPLWMILGSALCGLAVVVYLAWSGAWRAFIEICKTILPLYSTIRQPWTFLHFRLDAYLEALRLLALPSGLLLLCEKKAWVKSESISVCLGMGCGFVAYWTQGKGVFYHLDPLIAFLGVWCALVVATLMKDDRLLIRLPLAIAVAFWIFTWVPRLLYVSAGQSRVDAATEEIVQTRRLESEILNLRAAGKDKGIQVMDMSASALRALYDLRIVHNSKFFYEFYFYNQPGSPIVRDLRAQFLREMNTSTPDLFIIARHSWPDDRLEYKRLDQWPELESFLQSNYDLKDDWQSFRIYVHR